MIPWDHALDVAKNHEAAARAAIETWEWHGVWHGGTLPSGECVWVRKVTWNTLHAPAPK